MQATETTAEAELEVLKGWKLKAEFRGLGLFEDLAKSEFLPGEQQRRLIDRRFSAVARFAAERSPFYRNYLAGHGLAGGDLRSVEDLGRLPVLDKDTVIERETEFHADSLPPSEKVTVTAYSSGTTGKRTRVIMTNKSDMMFTVLSIRLYRWFRLDLSKTLAQILSPRSLADPLDESPPRDAQGESGDWGYAGTFFETGPAVFMSSAVEVERRQAWLEQHRPGCLVTYPTVLEEHAFARPEGGIVDSLDAVVGISSQMSAPMRRRIEQAFRVPVEQNYGANEIGIIAGRCRAGRYHVQSEHCHVEIVDEEGQACAPGEAGRILVSGFNNLAMPLFRYETGDLATVPSGPCPCGRTLPSFQHIEGRFRRWLNVPPGTNRRYFVLTDAFEGLPREMLRDVRGFQLHLNLDNTLVFRVASTGPLPAAMTEALLAGFRQHFPAEVDRLSIERVARFEVPPNGKIPEFTTDYPEQPYVAPAP